MDELIEKQLSQKELFHSFLLQLEKDFEMAGIDASFVASLPDDFQQMKHTLKQHVANGLHASSSNLVNLLYRIDIPESLMKSFSSNPANFLDSLVELIIKRILQKVILKKQYSTNA